MAGEYTTQVMREGLREFLRRNRPESLQTHPAVAADAAAASAAQPEIVEIARAARQTRRAAHHLPQACRGADGGSAAAPGRLLYRLPRAPDLRR